MAFITLLFLILLMIKKIQADDGGSSWNLPFESYGEQYQSEDSNYGTDHGNFNNYYNLMNPHPGRSYSTYLQNYYQRPALHDQNQQANVFNVPNFHLLSPRAIVGDDGSDEQAGMQAMNPFVSKDTFIDVANHNKHGYGLTNFDWLASHLNDGADSSQEGKDYNSVLPSKDGVKVDGDSSEDTDLGNKINKNNGNVSGKVMSQENSEESGAGENGLGNGGIDGGLCWLLAILRQITSTQVQYCLSTHSLSPSYPTQRTTPKPISSQSPSSSTPAARTSTIQATTFKTRPTSNRSKTTQTTTEKVTTARKRTTTVYISTSIKPSTPQTTSTTKKATTLKIPTTTTPPATATQKTTRPTTTRSTVLTTITSKSPATTTTTTTTEKPSTTSTTKATTSKPVIPEICLGAQAIDKVGYKPHWSDCSKFIQCTPRSDGTTTVYIKSCSSGTLWDQKTLSCNQAQLVDCPNDRCKTNDLERYPSTKSCSSYFVCKEGKSYSACCPHRHSYEPSRGCVPDERCLEDCQGNKIEKDVCDRRPVVNRPLMYEQYVDRRGWQLKTCPPGFSYNNEVCHCSAKIDVTSPQIDCDPELYIPFNNGDIKDESGNNNYLQVDGVKVIDGAGYFDGKSLIRVPKFSNFSFGDTFIIKLRYKEEGSRGGSSGRPQALMANGDCNKPSSLYLATGSSHLDIGLRAKNGRAANISIPNNQNGSGWKEALLAVDKNVLTGSLNGVSHQTLFKGSMDSSKCSLQIGRGTEFGHFHGYMDDITVYLCKPKGF